jgi:hypothetical protein
LEINELCWVNHLLTKVPSGYSYDDDITLMIHDTPGHFNSVTEVHGDGGDNIVNHGARRRYMACSQDTELICMDYFDLMGYNKHYVPTSFDFKVCLTSLEKTKVLMGNATHCGNVDVRFTDLKLTVPITKPNAQLSQAINELMIQKNDECRFYVTSYRYVAIPLPQGSRHILQNDIFNGARPSRLITKVVWQTVYNGAHTLNANYVLESTPVEELTENQPECVFDEQNQDENECYSNEIEKNEEGEIPDNEENIVEQNSQINDNGDDEYMADDEYCENNNDEDNNELDDEALNAFILQLLEAKRISIKKRREGKVLPSVKKFLKLSFDQKSKRENLTPLVIKNLLHICDLMITEKIPIKISHSDKSVIRHILDKDTAEQDIKFTFAEDICIQCCIREAVKHLDSIQQEEQKNGRNVKRLALN